MKGRGQPARRVSFHKPHDRSSDNSQELDTGFSKTKVMNNLDKRNLVRRWATKPGWSVFKERGKETRKWRQQIETRTKKIKHFPAPFQHAVNKMSSAC